MLLYALPAMFIMRSVLLRLVLFHDWMMGLASRNEIASVRYAWALRKLRVKLSQEEAGIDKAHAALLHADQAHRNGAWLSDLELSWLVACRDQDQVPERDLRLVFGKRLFRPLHRKRFIRIAWLCLDALGSLYLTTIAVAFALLVPTSIVLGAYPPSPGAGAALVIIQIALTFLAYFCCCSLLVPIAKAWAWRRELASSFETAFSAKP